MELMRDRMMDPPSLAASRQRAIGWVLLMIVAFWLSTQFGRPWPIKSSSESPSSESVTPRFEVDLNRAPSYELQLLPGVGPTTAREIESRRSQKEFEAMSDLDDVRGLGKARVEQIQNNAFVRPKGPGNSKP